MDMHIVTKLLQLRSYFKYLYTQIRTLAMGGLFTQFNPITNINSPFYGRNLWRLKILTSCKSLYCPTIVTTFKPSIPCNCFIPAYDNTFSIAYHCSHKVLRVKFHSTMLMCWVYFSCNAN